MSFSYKCVNCGKVFNGDLIISRCLYCGGLLFVEYEVDELRVSDIQTMWRYKKILPIHENEKIISLSEGFTPLIRAENLEKIVGFSRIYLKDETRNPTGSFNDRGISLEISKIVNHGINNVVCATRGDTGVSLAAYASKAGINATIYVPRTIDTGKLYQIAMYGAKLKLVRSFNNACSLAESHKLEAHVFRPSNPLFLEGLKTVGIEIIEQLGWETPDAIIVPMGNGGLATMLFKAMNELQALGLIDEKPMIIGVQIKGQDTILSALTRGLERIETLEDFGKIIARDLLIEDLDLANNTLQMLKKGEIKGASISYKEVIQAVENLAKSEGILSEPASAVAIAAIKRIYDEGLIDKGDTIVSIVTGSGLRVPNMFHEILKKKGELREIIDLVVSGQRISRIGVTKLKILEILKNGSLYGYELKKKLEHVGIKISLATLYQHLRELEKLGLISRIEGWIGKKKRVYYVLTNKGFQILEGLSHTH
ncbi:MAG: threonine synthase [Candidatus Njordarchaeales archaeon]